MNQCCTHTFSKLSLSESAFNEIKDKLQATGYDHLFINNDTINMDGIGITKESSLILIDK
jgi:hypothetical protein